jgi:hypothetical protein
MCNPRREDKTSIKKYTRNLEKAMPLDRKLKYIAKNMWIRASKLQLCCGHPGQPGC